MKTTLAKNPQPTIYSTVLTFEIILLPHAVRRRPSKNCWHHALFPGLEVPRYQDKEECSHACAHVNSGTFLFCHLSFSSMHQKTMNSDGHFTSTLLYSRELETLSVFSMSLFNYFIYTSNIQKYVRNNSLGEGSYLSYLSRLGNILSGHLQQDKHAFNSVVPHRGFDMSSCGSSLWTKYWLLFTLKIVSSL